MIYLGSDHAGYDLKEQLKNILQKNDIQYKDLTPKLSINDDYPDAARKVGEKVVKGKAQGVLMCGTGMGICMAANKIKGVRAALVYNAVAGKLAKEHNDANIICFGGRTMNIKEVEKSFFAWYNARFQPEQRHMRRIRKIEKLK